MSKFSILMNGYNCEQFVKEAIESVYAQSDLDWEIVFVDNCSTDTTSEIVSKFDNRIKYHKTDFNIPLGEARNIGLGLCTGDFIAFLDTDDLWLPEKISLQRQMFDEDSSLKMIYTGAFFIDQNGNTIGGSVPKAKTGSVFSQQLKRYEINMQSVVIRNDIDILFDPTKKYAEDFDLFLKLSVNYNVGVIPDKLVKYRKHSLNLSHNSKDIEWSEQYDILNDVFNSRPDLKIKYPREYNLAYARVAYYKARYFVNNDNILLARNSLKEYKLCSPFYFCLYVLLFLPSIFWQRIHQKLRFFS